MVGLAGPAQVASPQFSHRRRAGECVLAINGHDVREFADADNALRLNVDDVVQIDALSSEPTTVTRVSVDMPIGPSIPVQTFRHRAGGAVHRATADGRHQRIGIGWYHVEVRSGPCHGAFWVRVYGRSPLTTAIGAGAAVVLVAGVGVMVMALRRARRGRSSVVWGVIGGLIVGIALCVLAQQFSVVAFTHCAGGVSRRRSGRRRGNDSGRQRHERERRGRWAAPTPASTHRPHARLPLRGRPFHRRRPSRCRRPQRHHRHQRR